VYRVDVHRLRKLQKGTVSDDENAGCRNDMKK
jgi:hypothetical protein